mmetsp:Transcript_9144/g.11716  ORF Transcript_9144/g.11716 Transcript_9144/m.11716 type:complete len:249 (-) Transcript_9144:309-1055(-)
MQWVRYKSSKRIGSWRMERDIQKFNRSTGTGAPFKNSTGVSKALIPPLEKSMKAMPAVRVNTAATIISFFTSYSSSTALNAEKSSGIGRRFASSDSSSFSSSAVSHLSVGSSPAVSRSITCAALTPPSAWLRCSAFTFKRGVNNQAEASAYGGGLSTASTSGRMLPSTRDLSNKIVFSASCTSRGHAGRGPFINSARLDITFSHRGRSSSAFMSRNLRLTLIRGSSASNISRAWGREINLWVGASLDR